MKLFKNLKFADILLLIVPVTLLVPNLYICLLENFSFAGWTATLMLPLCIYVLLMTISRNTPRTAVFMFPLMILAAFQIVISYLYHDGSPIGVDMFLNVVTTNSTEIDELLSSIAVPVALVIVLYLPLLIMSIVGWKRQRRADNRILHIFRKTGLAISVLGIAASIYWFKSEPSYHITSDLFPFNALYNSNEAAFRNKHMSEYAETSENFSYGATKIKTDDKELYIAVVGETARADNWGLFGYHRNTTPRLSQYGDSIVAFGKVFSESNTTHTSVPMLLNTLSSENFKDEVYRHKSIITAFKEAGFRTTFISVQKPNKSLIEFYADEADDVHYIGGVDKLPAKDEGILPMVDSIIAAGDADKRLIVLHLYGSHYDYSDRYPAEFSVFTPDKCDQANSQNRNVLLNAYDNTIVYTDFMLSELIARAKAVNYNAALIYTSDHGEDLFDDSRKKFLHASPAPTYWQLHVPMIVYMNQAYTDSHPGCQKAALSNRNKLVSSSKSYSHTLLHLAGIKTGFFIPSQSLLSRQFTPPKKLHYLNDLNEPVDLMIWGFDDTDKANFRQTTEKFLN